MSDEEVSERQVIVITEDTPEDPDGGDWLAKSNEKKLWHMRVSRKLTDEEFAQMQILIDSRRTWDEDDEEYHLVRTWGCIKAVAEDITLLGWWHRPYEIFIRGLRTPAKVYVIENATHYEAAKQHARQQYHEAFKGSGVAGSIIEVRKATKKDMKKMVAFDG